MSDAVQADTPPIVSDLPPATPTENNTELVRIMQERIQNLEAAQKTLTEKLSVKIEQEKSLQTPEIRLRNLEESLKARDEKLIGKQKTIALREAINATGIAPVFSQIFQDHILMQHGSKINVTDDSVTINDDLNRPIPIGDFVKSYFESTKILDKFRPAQSLPSGIGLRGAGVNLGAGKRMSEMTDAEYLALPMGVRASLARAEIEGR